MGPKPSSEKNAVRLGHSLAAVAITAILILALSILFLKGKKNPSFQIEEVSAKELIGETVEERLSRHIDIANAKITPITDADTLKVRYGSIFANASDGQYLVETPDSIRVYDFEHDEFIAHFEYRTIRIQ